MRGPIFTSTRSRARALTALALLAVAVAVASLGLRAAVPGLTDPAWLRARVEAYGSLAPVVFVLAQAAQVVFAPVPGQALAFASGYLFGPLYGALYSLVGAALGSAVAFALARRLGRPYVARVVTTDTLAAFDGLADRDGRFALFLAFLLPGFPDDVICFVAGVSRLPLWQLLGISVLGRVPGYLLLSYAGARFASADYLVTSAILVVFAALAVLAYWRKDAILGALRGR